MSEETEGQDTGAEAVAGGVAGVDPAAAALALSGASREDAGAFLNKQGTLVDEQRGLVADQRRLIADQRHHLHLGLWEKRIGVALRLATLCVGLGVAAGLGLMLWDAVNSDRFLIEPFSTPPDFAARGMSGQVVAARLLDALGEIQEQSATQFAPRSYGGSWEASDIKLDIPETGVSLEELENFLRAHLGNDTRLSGEIVRTPSGLSLSARVGNGAVASVSGPEADADALMGKLAEQIFRITQPYRFGQYVRNFQNRYDESAASVYAAMIRSNAREERAFGYNGRSSVTRDRIGFVASIPDVRRALAIDPDSHPALNNLAVAERFAGRAEASLKEYRADLAVLSNPSHGKARTDFLPAYQQQTRADIDAALGAFREAVREREDIIDVAVPGPKYYIGDQIFNLIAGHEPAMARAMLAPGAMITPLRADDNAFAREVLTFQSDDWQTVLLQAQAYARLNPRPRDRIELGYQTVIAQARLGNFAAAEAGLAAMPADCNPCMIAHGLVAELRGQRARADWWFAHAVASAPSIPFASYEWGRVLLARGKPDDAIAQFALSNKKGPHFADALEGWGEALMAKSQSHLALAKFEEAQKYAPNWSRLHLKWGEALWFAGRKDEAEAQFTRAAALDLTPSEKSELARHL